jgi:signal transduction histidine kinase
MKHFKTNVLLKSIIGKDLINDDNIAVNELVKNSYDANSKTVDIIFRNLKENDDSTSITSSAKSSKIIIQDFGIGMDEIDIEEKWLNIAYSEKKSTRVAFQRVLAGAKGVGRFSCDRLGEYLDLYTRKKNGMMLHLHIDWKQFEVEERRDLEIQSVEIAFKEIPIANFRRETGFKPFEHGTILEISKLRAVWASEVVVGKKIEWSSSKILQLRKSLEKLINPNQAFNKLTFSINLIAKEFVEEDRSLQEYERINGPIANRIFEKLDYTSTSITSSIDDTGKIITTTISDKGRDIFVLREKNVLLTKLRNVHLVLYYLNTYSKIYFARQTGIRTVDFGSVYMFINGFRIPPYGDQGDDWLGLETRKGQGYARFLGTRELIGRIEVSDDRNQFRIVSSREGLVKDENYYQLVDAENKSGFFYLTLKRLERYVVEGLKWDRVVKKSVAGEDAPDEVDSRKLSKIIREFEQKVQSPKWRFNPKEEVYFEDQTTKDRRIVALLAKIIDTKPENIIDLRINSELIVELADAERAKANDEFKKLIERLPHLGDEEILRQISSIEKSEIELSTALEKMKAVPLVKLDALTNSAIKQSSKVLLRSQREVQRNKEAILSLLAKKELLEQKTEEEEEARQQAEEDKRQLEIELEFERDKNTYLRTSSRSLSEEAKALVHNVKITSKRIIQTVDSLCEGGDLAKMSMAHRMKHLAVIKLNAERALAISLLITRSNFKRQDAAQQADVAKFIEQYFSIYAETYDKLNLHFQIINKSSERERWVRLLDLSVVLDDLISNAEKANARHIRVEMTNPQKDSLRVTFSDDGNGVPPVLMKDKEKMFELGVSTTEGSGIGLHSIRTALRIMNAEIRFLGNGVKLKGACFELTFS